MYEHLSQIKFIFACAILFLPFVHTRDIKMDFSVFCVVQKLRHKWKEPFVKRIHYVILFKNSASASHCICVCADLIDERQYGAYCSCRKFSIHTQQQQKDTTHRHTYQLTSKNMAQNRNETSSTRLFGSGEFECWFRIPVQLVVDIHLALAHSLYDAHKFVVWELACDKYMLECIRVLGWPEREREWNCRITDKQNIQSLYHRIGILWSLMHSLSMTRHHYMPPKLENISTTMKTKSSKYDWLLMFYRLIQSQFA